MLIKQTILIIGTGETGRAMAARLAKGNFRMLLCDKDYTKAMALVNDLNGTAQGCDVEAMECSFDSAWEADVIILTMQLEEQNQVAEIIKDVITQKILISIFDGGLPAACGHIAGLRQLLPNTKIVRILTDDNYNTPDIFDKNSTGIMLAGNDDNSVEAVSRMLESVGIYSTRVEDLSVSANKNKI